MNGDWIRRHSWFRDAGDVTRFHTLRTIRQQSVAHHSWGVATLLLHVWPEAPASVLRAALWHDVAEIETGDMPAPIKWANPELKKELGDVRDAFKALIGK